MKAYAPVFFRFVDGNVEGVENDFVVVFVEIAAADLALVRMAVTRMVRAVLVAGVQEAAEIEAGRLRNRRLGIVDGVVDWADESLKAHHARAERFRPFGGRSRSAGRR